MRSLYISLTLFCLLIACVICNSIFIHHSADTILEYSTAPTDAADIDDLCDFWEKRRELIGLSVSEIKLENIDRIVVSIRCDFNSGDEASLEKDLVLLADAAEGLKRHERISLENIF